MIVTTNTTTQGFGLKVFIGLYNAFAFGEWIDLPASSKDASELIAKTGRRIRDRYLSTYGQYIEEYDVFDTDIECPIVRALFGKLGESHWSYILRLSELENAGIDIEDDNQLETIAAYFAIVGENDAIENAHDNLCGVYEWLGTDDESGAKYAEDSFYETHDTDNVPMLRYINWHYYWSGDLRHNLSYGEFNGKFWLFHNH